MKQLIEFSESDIKLDFEIVKKELVEDPNKLENSLFTVKQEYFSKPELNLDWDDKCNVQSITLENVDDTSNTFNKLYEPRVVLERLPDSVLAKYCKLKCLNLKTENLVTKTEKVDDFAENAFEEPDVEGATLKDNSFLSSVECSKCKKKCKNQLSLQRHLLSCEKVSHLHYCCHCAFKTKFKSALKIHISKKHSTKRTARKKLNPFSESSMCDKKLRKNKASKSDINCNKKTECTHKNDETKNRYKLNSHRLFGAKYKNGLQKNMENCHSDGLQVCLKCNKKFKYKKSLSKHSMQCNGRQDFQTNHCTDKAYQKTDSTSHDTSSSHLKKNKCQKDGFVFPKHIKRNKQLKNKTSLKIHSSRDKSRCRQCTFCSYKSNQISNLKRHVKLMHIEKDVNRTLPCSRCSRIYKNKNSLYAHLLFCGKEPELQCDYCSHKTWRKQDMAKHVIAVHLEKDVNYFLLCSNCGKRYKNQRSLVRHKSICGIKPPLKCNDCSYKTHFKSDLRKHIVAIHLENNLIKSSLCLKCGKHYKNESTLSSHKLLCGKEPNLHCDYCSYKTKRKSSLGFHILLVHLEKDKNYFLHCSKCGRYYRNQSSLNRHNYYCGKPPRFECDYCSRKSKLKSELAKHIIAVHLEKNVNHNLSCSKCDRKYKNQISLTGHLRFCGKEPLVQCDHCSHKTWRKADMSKHILSHHMIDKLENVSVCEKCNGIFKNKFSLRFHSAHCGIEPNLKCDHCSHTTKRKHDLKMHILSMHRKKSKNP